MGTKEGEDIISGLKVQINPRYFESWSYLYSTFHTIKRTDIHTYSLPIVSIGLHANQQTAHRVEWRSYRERQMVDWLILLDTASKRWSPSHLDFHLMISDRKFFFRNDWKLDSGWKIGFLGARFRCILYGVFGATSKSNNLRKNIARVRRSVFSFSLNVSRMGKL